MSGRVALRANEKALLRLDEAAEYCSVSPSVFERVCPVRPISLAERLEREDRRLLRWSRMSLDEWIARMDGRGLPDGGRDWLAEVD
jgi:predicted DNA-binding transcriptional regulator AlpA